MEHMQRWVTPPRRTTTALVCVLAGASAPAGAADQPRRRSSPPPRAALRSPLPAGREHLRCRQDVPAGYAANTADPRRAPRRSDAAAATVTVRRLDETASQRLEGTAVRSGYAAVAPQPSLGRTLTQPTPLQPARDTSIHTRSGPTLTVQPLNPPPTRAATMHRTVERSAGPSHQSDGLRTPKGRRRREVEQRADNQRLLQVLEGELGDSLSVSQRSDRRMSETRRSQLSHV
eukprot:TRINITY_DN9960_c0_g2_i1.p2 TRINITY_DN9960_c0_g2~~TRINITY_DN9960_c0_g2_i1.p2  ORF type:complete len:232 (+),score=43.58 TRINITY_DN9960_c0_g2_i1:49-744(+)